MQTLGGLLVSPVLVFYHKFLHLSLWFFLLMFMDFPSTFRFITKFMRFPPIGPRLAPIQLPLPPLIFLLCLRVLHVAKNGATDSSSNSKDQVFDIMSLKILALLGNGDKQASGKRWRYVRKIPPGAPTLGFSALEPSLCGSGAPAARPSAPAVWTFIPWHPRARRGTPMLGDHNEIGAPSPDVLPKRQWINPIWRPSNVY
ncbi:hypothetical protein Fmac_024754 [Flemingia macrophylla]|uniref:Uncharacterized protein n=1 Tax=Flemingia macrophylla TaxID=520843 RepID=A0ABD1LQ91_9FABA